MGSATVHVKIKLQHQEPSTGPLSDSPQPPHNLPLLHSYPCTHLVNLILTRSVSGDHIKVKSLPLARSKSVATGSQQLHCPWGQFFLPAAARCLEFITGDDHGLLLWPSPEQHQHTAPFLPSSSSNTLRWGSRPFHPGISTRKGYLLNTMSDTRKPEPGKGWECEAYQEGKQEPKVLALV